MHEFWDWRFLLRHVVRTFVRRFVRQIVCRTEYRRNPAAALRWLVENGYVHSRATPAAQPDRGHFPLETQK